MEMYAAMFHDAFNQLQVHYNVMHPHFPVSIMLAGKLGEKKFGECMGIDAARKFEWI